MFESQAHPRVFTVPVGRSYLIDLVSGLESRLRGQPPEAMARIEIFVNTRRAERNLHALLTQRGACLLPRIRLITEIASHPRLPIELPAPISPLRRRLLLAQLVKSLLNQQTGLAPYSATFDLADSLAAVMDELQGEGIPVSALEEIHVGDLSEHWENSLRFLRILSEHWDESAAVDPLDRQRRAAVSFAEAWKKKPPDHPVVVAGSTGSRDASAVFMRAVAELPLGAVILPGVDRTMPEESWDSLSDQKVLLDHPQSGINKFCKSLSLNPWKLPVWFEARPVKQNRNKLISLSLHPAPFTDRWLKDGPALIPTLVDATQNLTLVEAESKKLEARAVALRLRKAAEDGKSAALISPDRDLTRRVAANLKRWEIVPDDSAGRPLQLTPPGVFLRLLAGCFGRSLEPLALISLLKHPLAAQDEAGTGDYRRFARDLEREVLRGGAPYVDFELIHRWAAKSGNPSLEIWIQWQSSILEGMGEESYGSLADWVSRHRQVAENLAAGPNCSGSGQLWEKETGQAARSVFDRLLAESDAAGVLSAEEYTSLLLFELRNESVRDTITLHPDIAILGTLEARVQNADVVILGGLNEGIWPKLSGSDPWLSRTMRKQVGLPLPERQTGLSAHDYQQAISAPEVMISRSIRDGEAPTVASRWILRLVNLMFGLGPTGKSALAEMRLRGQTWLELAVVLDQPAHSTPKAPRPSPCPPITAKPRSLSVTQIKTLVRDPYAIYAREILKLKPMNMLGKEPDALVRGIALHRVAEEFVAQTLEQLPDNAAKLFVDTAEKVLGREAPWPATRRFWLARLVRIADWFVDGERTRRENGRVAALERSGKRKMVDPDFLLTAKADRVDIDSDGNLSIYDYKSGRFPTEREVRAFDKQLPLEAAIAESGGFQDLPAAAVIGLHYIGLSDTKSNGVGRTQSVAVEPGLTLTMWNELRQLILAYQQPEKGYPARARMQKSDIESAYDHLSRRGEWEDSDDAEVLPLP